MKWHTSYLQQQGYTYHINRLMVPGNLMLPCEFDPDDAYRWFTILEIHAYPP